MDISHKCNDAKAPGSQLQTSHIQSLKCKGPNKRPSGVRLQWPLPTVIDIRNKGARAQCNGDQTTRRPLNLQTAF